MHSLALALMLAVAWPRWLRCTSHCTLQQREGEENRNIDRMKKNHSDPNWYAMRTRRERMAPTAAATTSCERRKHSLPWQLPSSAACCA